MRQSEDITIGQKTNFKVRVVFFSGTGCTALCVKALSASLAARGCSVICDELRVGGCKGNAFDEDLLVIMYPVHAFDAPTPVYEFLAQMPEGKGKNIAVIATSGAGEMFPNRASRFEVCRQLEAKRYRIVFEDMIPMPSNWIVPTPEDAAVALLQRLPATCKNIATDLLAGNEKRLHAPLGDRIFSKIAILEKGKMGQIRFGEKITPTEACTLCGWCSRNCPRNNIEQTQEGLRFGSSCVLCLRCIYGCPHQALKPGFAKFIAIKEGFSLNALKGREQADIDSALAQTNKLVWKGVYRYLREDD
ncbi:MAG: EFR1 family ferrodoxin [Raoultibacter sp.]|jgi:ferredoxin/flavodoxin